LDEGAHVRAVGELQPRGEEADAVDVVEGGVGAVKKKREDDY
jgi:hypothetical protein